MMLNFLIKIKKSEYELQFDAYQRLEKSNSKNILEDEKIISKNAQFSYWYAQFFNKRFIIGEKAIINDNMYCILYISKILSENIERFSTYLEKELSMNKENWRVYSNLILDISCPFNILYL